MLSSPIQSKDAHSGPARPEEVSRPWPFGQGRTGRRSGAPPCWAATDWGSAPSPHRRKTHDSHAALHAGHNTHRHLCVDQQGRAVPRHPCRVETAAASGRLRADRSPSEGLLMITIESVTKTYGSTTVVDHVSFRARPGRVTGFLGP